MPPKKATAASDEQTATFLKEVIYQGSMSGVKLDAKAVKNACKHLDFSHETWRKKFSKMMKDYEISRKADQDSTDESARSAGDSEDDSEDGSEA